MVVLCVQADTLQSVAASCNTTAEKLGTNFSFLEEQAAQLSMRSSSLLETIAQLQEELKRHTEMLQQSACSLHCCLSAGHLFCLAPLLCPLFHHLCLLSSFFDFSDKVEEQSLKQQAEEKQQAVETLNTEATGISTQNGEHLHCV